ncbi:receptor-type tyrosine-protein phosphatase T-like [Dreissena polymorpha]|uniref:receptor-type tyrosine-protein phosphatase T-like n=1 Tax=Dreissena polymorpha TaxID=45954 RepID=UPI0022646630|nr:receptor-type tyrosine-protein phosphatase T-like [Dreissena polymorpha]
MEVAKIAVRIPTFILDTAKVAVSVAQVIVDKSRVFLDIGEVAISFAQLGLEGAKWVLEGAKYALKAVPFKLYRFLQPRNVTDIERPQVASVQVITTSVQVITASAQFISTCAQVTTASVQVITASAQVVTVNVQVIIVSVQVITSNVHVINARAQVTTVSVQVIIASAQVITVSVKVIAASVQVITVSVKASKNIVTTYAPNTEGPAKDSLPLAAIGGGAGVSHDSNGKSVTVATQNSTTAPKDKRDTGSKTDIDIAMNEENLEIDADEALARIRAIKFEEQGGVYYNSANEIQTGKIRVSELQKFVANKDTDIFEEEFEKLPYGLIKKYDESQRTVNMSMNRYKGIYPYNDSRVKVLGGHTDYINASFIDGYKRRNAFIATLGPMSKQLDDFAPFWRMIWQQKVDNIVMVTNLVEEGKDKCEQYWPNVESSTLYGDIRVSCTTEDKHAEFIRRTFVINLKKEQRNVYHLHFTAWPDKWIPEDVTSIVEFRQKVLNVPVVLGGPTVVHCSAGIGRTGTYIALDILIREGENENMVDIPGCVVNMRQNRPNMVQTVEQYEYIHHALIHALTFDCKPVARDEFQKYMDGITDETMARKFTQLQTTVSQRPSEEKEAETRNRNHTDKNRDGADIPGDDNRPRLHLNLKPGASDYINAVYINSYRKAKHWILAQTPLPGTVTDFLTLALQENCSCIVSMEPDKEGDKTVGVYIAADNQVMKKGLFAVSGSDPVDNDYMTTRSMTISYRAAPGQPSKEHMIQHLQFTDWDMDRNVPRSPSNFLRFIKDVEAQDSLHASGPVLIHCLNGADKGGLLSVVAMLIEMMEVEREVSVVNAITKVKTRRRGVVSNQEQFAFCHECILEYISSFDTYSNYVNNLRI